MLHFLITVLPASAQQDVPTTHETTIIKLIEIIRAERDPIYRAFLAGSLPQLVESGKPESTNAAVVDALAGLLDDDNEGVRSIAASILDTIGAAARTTPLRLEAMKRADTVRSTHETTIIKLIEIIRAEQDRFYKYFLATNLPELVESGKPESTNSTVVDALAGLLDDDEDGVRSSAASALGNIGPAAARTAPRLLEAMRRAEAEFIRPGELRPSSFSGDSICEALQRIGTPQQGTPCQFFPGTSVPGAYSGRAR
jgi:hypothetical protein